jgi:hypothetical protein
MSVSTKLHSAVSQKAIMFIPQLVFGRSRVQISALESGYVC